LHSTSRGTLKNPKRKVKTKGAYATMSQVISVRYSDDEYMDILMKLANKEGKPIMSPSKFSKCATLTGKVTLVNQEVEQYKVFVLGKISNNINQIAHRLNSDNLSGKLNNKTYIDNLESLENLLKQVNELTDPIR
jgi:hypothetical protein